MAYEIAKEKCIGCGACAWACLFDVPVYLADETKYTIPKEKCVGCGNCRNICPNNAISPCADHREIRSVSINPEKCIGCTVCAHICPEKAPYGERGKPFTIMQEKCTRCGACAAKCRHDAIDVTFVS